MSVYLIRHPKPAIEPDICYGRSDIPLAGPLEPLLPSLRAQLPADYRLVSSPLQRCAQLAQALHPQPQFDPRLQELDFGHWELQHWTALGASTLDNWIASGLSDDIHGGESAAAFQRRIFHWCSEQIDQTQPLVVITHAGVIRTILARINGWPLLQAMNHPLEYASITRIAHQDWPPCAHI
jgi:alpha-ribazole phosphatase